MRRHETFRSWLFQKAHIDKDQGHFSKFGTKYSSQPYAFAITLCYYRIMRWRND